MMRDFFFGTFAVAGWFIAATILVSCATYLWLIVREVGGLRGAILATMFSCLALVCSCFGLIISDQELIPSIILGAIVTAVFPAIVIGAVILTDLYAADRNSHRSFTARFYFWYKRATHDDGEESGPRHPASIHRVGG